MDNYAHWADLYSKLPRAGRIGYEYSTEAYDVFPRYNVLAAICEAVETLIPADFDSLDQIQKELVNISAGAENMLTKPPNNSIAMRAMSAERLEFAKYVRGLDPSALDMVEPLPYRRTLRQVEEGAIRQRMRDRWMIGDEYWYPLSERPPLADIEAFDVDKFWEAIQIDSLRQIMRFAGVYRVQAIAEYGASCEVELDSFNPGYTGAEWFFTSDSEDWIIYISHESSITVGGWLLDSVKRAWPAWRTNLYSSPFEN